MATLTAAQFSYLRDLTGDDDPDSSGDYLIDDTVLQAIYDDSTLGNGVLDRTAYHALRRIRGKLMRKIAMTSEVTGANEQAQQWYEHVVATLDTLGKELGLGRGAITSGTLSLDIDSVEEVV